MVFDTIRSLCGTVACNGHRITGHDIGVIAPYQSQSKQLHRKLRMYPDIIIGTVEKFQGSEKPIIIISTVRTDRNLGFVANDRVSKNIPH